MLTKADIDWLKSEYLPDLAEAVKNALAEKLDNINTKLDKFAGDIQDKRDAQEPSRDAHGRSTLPDHHWVFVENHKYFKEQLSAAS